MPLAASRRSALARSVESEEHVEAGVGAGHERREIADVEPVGRILDQRDPHSRATAGRGVVPVAEARRREPGPAEVVREGDVGEPWFERGDDAANRADVANGQRDRADRGDDQPWPPLEDVERRAQRLVGVVEAHVPADDEVGSRFVHVGGAVCP